MTVNVPNPDAKILRLGRLFDAIHAEDVRVAAEDEATGGDTDRDHAAQEAHTAIINEMADTPATTLAGLKAKARAALNDAGIYSDEAEALDELAAGNIEGEAKLLASIIRDTLALADA